eukprot:gene24887-10551_t
MLLKDISEKDCAYLAQKRVPQVLAHELGRICSESKRQKARMSEQRAGISAAPVANKHLPRVRTDSFLVGEDPEVPRIIQIFEYCNRSIDSQLQLPRNSSGNSFSRRAEQKLVSAEEGSSSSARLRLKQGNSLRESQQGYWVCKFMAPF